MKHIFDHLDDKFKEMFEERAAIVEYDGKQSRSDAERTVMAEMRAKIDSDKEASK